MSYLLLSDLSNTFFYCKKARDHVLYFGILQKDNGKKLNSTWFCSSSGHKLGPNNTYSRASNRVSTQFGPTLGLKPLKAHLTFTVSHSVTAD